MIRGSYTLRVEVSPKRLSMSRPPVLRCSRGRVGRRVERLGRLGRFVCLIRRFIAI